MKCKVVYCFKSLRFLRSYFLYTISCPDKYGDPQHDLSEEIQVASQALLSKKQIRIERVIHKVFQHYSIPKECISDNIRARFKTKLWRIGKAISLMGGPKRKQQLHKWKEGSQSTWLLSTDLAAVHNQLQKENDVMKAQLNKYQDLQKKNEVEVYSHS